MMRYLLDEAEVEADYTQRYRDAENVAKVQAELLHKDYWELMPEEFERYPNKSKIKRRMKMIRELALKFYEA